jgi:hypothetical protein
MGISGYHNLTQQGARRRALREPRQVTLRRFRAEFPLSKPSRMLYRGESLLFREKADFAQALR